MRDVCRLKAAVGIHAHCDEETCVYWRALGHLGVDLATERCAIEHFELLGDNEEVVAWLLSVKERVEREAADVSTGQGRTA